MIRIWCVANASSSNWKVKHLSGQDGTGLSSRFQRLEVASDHAAAYLGRMPLTRLLRILTLIAVIFAPLSMAGGHAAMAMPAAPAAMSDHMGAMPAGHCADMEGKQDKNGPSAPSIDCMIACSAMPAADFEVEVHPLTAAFIEPARLVGALHGLSPESDPPPPRIS